MIREAIVRLSEAKGLKFDEAKEVFEEIFSTTATSAQIGAFLALLSCKGESEVEIAAAAQVVRNYAYKVQVKRDLAGIVDEDDIVFDSCGTGGGGGTKFNISTAVAFVVAAAGIKVAKHGNRAMSSKSGSGDCFEALGVNIDIPHEVTQNAIKNIGIGFLYAPLYHPALKYVAAIRRELGIKTIFNIIGPLSNPAEATHQLLGVYKKELLPVVANALKSLGVKRAFVVYSDDLKDEVSLSGKTFVAFLNKGKIEFITLNAKSFGLKPVDNLKVRVKCAKDSAKVVKQVLSGKVGPCRDIVLANAGCALFIAGKALTIKDGVKLAARLIDEGAAKEKLKQLIDLTKNYHA